MRHPYTHAAGEWLPLLEVGVHMPNGYRLGSMLVDSGSQETLLPLSFLLAFGVELGDEQIDLVGVGGRPIAGRPATVGFAVDGRRFPARVVAVEDRHLFIPLLGHRGFFEHFRVTFDTSARSFALRAAH